MLSGLFSYIGRNKVGLGLITVAIAVIVGTSLFGCGGLGDIIKLDVPKGIQDTTGAKPRVSLTESEFVFEEYKSKVELSARQFQQNIDQAEAWRLFFSNLADTGIKWGQTAAANSGFPGGGAITLLLGGLGGLFLEKPGSKRKAEAAARALADEHYDDGKAAGIEAALKGVAAASGPALFAAPSGSSGGPG